MKGPGQGWRRTGSTILLVLVLTAIAAIAIMTFFSTVRQERSRTGKLVQRIRAQAMARRVVARIVALVQQKPWSERFFREDRYSFYSSEGLFKEDSPEFSKGDVSYEGSCQQLSAQSKRYRIKLRVKYPAASLAERDYSYFSSWDLQYSEGILGNLNRTHILASADSDDPDVPEDELDRQLDLIRNTARKPSNEPQLAGTPGEPYIDDVRKAEEQHEGVKAGELGRPPTDMLPVPPTVDGSAEGLLDMARRLLATASTTRNTDTGTTPAGDVPPPTAETFAQARDDALQRANAYFHPPGPNYPYSGTMSTGNSIFERTMNKFDPATGRFTITISGSYRSTWGDPNARISGTISFIYDSAGRFVSQSVRPIQFGDL